MKVLVLGQQGMLAREVVPCLARAGFTVLSRGRPEVDITQPASLRQALVDTHPDLLLNAAAYTAVDQAEMEPEAALAVNRDGVAHLAVFCREGGLPLLHVSTDYVFDDSAARPYCEDDPAMPLGMYGRSKWEGEEAVRGCHQEHVIVRTAWLCGCHGRNFVKPMLRCTHEREVLRVVDDQYGCPTCSRDLAEALVIIWRRIVQSRDRVQWGT